MKKIISYLKNRRDRKLRERCIKYASQYGSSGRCCESITYDAYDAYCFVNRIGRFANHAQA